MGIVKRMMEQGFDSDLSKSICSSCINESGISEYIIRNEDTTLEDCSYCDESAPTEGFKACKMNMVVEYIHECISREWCDSANVLPYETKEGGYQGTVLDTQELLYDLGVEVLDDQIIIDIANSIENEYWCEQNYFSLSPDLTLTYGWDAFCKFVMNKSRYFFLQAHNDQFDPDQHDEMNPVDILNSVGSIVKNLGMFEEIPLTQVLKRVRIVDDFSEATSASELGSPPIEYCNMANRMSSAGISTFYGAFDLETAIKETYEPEIPLTKKAVVGNFFPCKPLKVIDLSKFFKFPSIFDEDQSHRFEKGFLADFIRDFTKPIERADKAHINYVPTQIVTEYFKIIFAKNNKTSVDGVIYPSSKNRGHKAVVIFAENDQCIEEASKAKDNSILALRNYEPVDLAPFN